MRDRVEFEWLNPKNEDQLKKLIAFSIEFDHEIKNINFPIIIAKVKDKYIGFTEVCNTPVLFPAFDPRNCSPRNVVEIIDGLHIWSKLANGDFLMARDMNASQFSNELLEEHFIPKRMNMELYEG